MLKKYSFQGTLTHESNDNLKQLLIKYEDKDWGDKCYVNDNPFSPGQSLGKTVKREKQLLHTFTFLFLHFHTFTFTLFLSHFHTLVFTL